MRIAMIGIKAIPARFGGFETAVDELSRGLVKSGHEVVVYNRSGMSKHAGKLYEGVELVTLPTLKSKNLSTMFHAFISSLHAMARNIDIVHYFTTGATLVAPLPRLLGKKVVCSVDGTDWQRAKWGRFARWYLRLSERLAVLFCHALISDSRDVMRYYRRRYGVDSACIVYGMRESKSSAHDALERFGLHEQEYVLFVGRLVPENNVHHLIRAFENVQTSKKLVIMGDDPWEKEYVRSLKSTRDKRVIFTGGVYGDGYAQLQQHAYVFVLPDEVGGTHPALVEAMGFGNCVLVNDTPSNLEVIGASGFKYSGSSGAEDLQVKLQFLLDRPDTVEEYRGLALKRARENYRWESVVEEHARFYQQVLDGRQAKGAKSRRGSLTPCDATGGGYQDSNSGDVEPELSENWSKPLHTTVKRALDILGSAFLLLLLSPLFLLLALLVKFTSPGPILYRWNVVGKGGVPFTSYKFRSMVANADDLKAALMKENEMSGPVFKLTRDPRVTPIGSWMRRHSLDELPQLHSVLKGDMSLVGPRPPLTTEYARFSDFQKQKLAVKPGITCLWQVSGRNDVSDFDQWVKLDLDYIRNFSLKNDLLILLATLREVLVGSGK